MNASFEFTPDSDGRDIFASPNSSPSQPLGLYTSPVTSGPCYATLSQIDTCSGTDYTLPTMPIHNSVPLLFVLLDPVQQRAYPYQCGYQYLGQDWEFFPYNPSERPNLNVPMAILMTGLSSPTTSSSDLPTMSTGDGPQSTLIDPSIINPQNQPHNNVLTANYITSYTPSREHESHQTPSHHSTQRPICPKHNCNKTFKGAYELKRHVETVHGPKEQCSYSGCQYKTGRKDKMVEHVTRRHGKVRD